MAGVPAAERPRGNRRGDPLLGPADRCVSGPGIPKLAEANRRRITRSFILILALAVGLAASAFAQPIGTPAPKWSELTPSERQFLSPFASEWDSWDAQRKAKWRGIAQRYPKMSPDEQERLRQQMTAWAQLSPTERAAARERYKRLKTLSPEQKQDM